MPDSLSIEIKGFLESSFLDWPGQIASVIFLSSTGETGSPLQLMIPAIPHINLYAFL